MKVGDTIVIPEPYINAGAVAKIENISRESATVIVSFSDGSTAGYRAKQLFSAMPQAQEEIRPGMIVTERHHGTRSNGPEWWLFVQEVLEGFVSGPYVMADDDVMIHWPVAEVRPVTMEEVKTAIQNLVANHNAPEKD